MGGHSTDTRTTLQCLCALLRREVSVGSEWALQARRPLPCLSCSALEHCANHPP